MLNLHLEGGANTPSGTTSSQQPSATQTANSSSSIQQLMPFNAPIWKVLVFDAVGRNVISPVLTVNELRDNGITVYLYVSQNEGRKTFEKKRKKKNKIRKKFRKRNSDIEVKILHTTRIYL